MELGKTFRIYSIWHYFPIIGPFRMESQKESLDILEDIVSSMEKEITSNKVQIVG